MEREQRKKIMTGAGIAATGLGVALILGAFNVIDIEYMSAAVVALASFVVNLVYVLFKGPNTTADAGTK